MQEQGLNSSIATLSKRGRLLGKGAFGSVREVGPDDGAPGLVAVKIAVRVLCGWVWL
jgi:hypothetical protein